jgi:hypothetical protein
MSCLFPYSTVLACLPRSLAYGGRKNMENGGTATAGREVRRNGRRSVRILCQSSFNSKQAMHIVILCMTSLNGASSSDGNVDCHAIITKLLDSST